MTKMEAIKIVVMEFENLMHKIVTMALEMIAPKDIAKKQNLIFKLLSPAIKLPVHTPVRGMGTETKVAKVKYCFKREFLFVTIFVLFLYFCKNLLVTKPAVLLFSFLITNIISRLGKIEPMVAIAKAENGDKAFMPQMSLFIASGIAILLSIVGSIATINTASQTQFEKFVSKNSINQFIQ